MSSTFRAFFFFFFFFMSSTFRAFILISSTFRIQYVYRQLFTFDKVCDLFGRTRNSAALGVAIDF